MNFKRKITATLWTAVVPFLLVACNSKAGEGIPKRIPCSVKVVASGKPVEAANVVLVSDALDGGISVSGKTDASGVAEIVTRRADFESKGAPEGEYKVAITKKIDVPDVGVSQEERAAMTPVERNAFNKEQQRILDEIPREIPKELSDFSKTPLKASVTSAGGEVLSVDVDEYK